MQESTGNPLNMKKQNLELLYRVLIEKKSATRAEIVEATRVSVTTIRSLLEELTAKGHVVKASQDESTGGRRATRYRLDPAQNRVLALYYLDEEIVYRVCSLTGDALHESVVHKSVYESPQHLFALLDDVLATWHICAIGLGVPGVVDNSNYLNRRDLNTWDVHGIGTQIKQRYALPLVLENDLNAMAAGYAGQCEDAPAHLAYVQFNQGCVCAGFLSEGALLHGASRFAGELTDLPYGGETLISALQRDGSTENLLAVIAYTLQLLICVTNPAVVVLSGERLQTLAPASLLAPLHCMLDRQVPRLVQPELRFRAGFREDYLSGLTTLSIEQLIPEIVNQTGSEE